MSKKNKMKISEDQMKKCNAIIHGASAAAGSAGTGLAQIPLSDNAVITPIQIGMIIALGQVFEQKISKSTATAILSGMTASFVGRGISQILVGWIPGVGNVINTATAAGVTEAVGWIAVDKFSKNQYIYSSQKSEVDGSDTVNEERERVEESKYDEHKQRADDFISGKKNKKINHDEYYQLLNDIEKALNNLPDGTPLKDMYNKLYDELFEVR